MPTKSTTTAKRMMPARRSMTLEFTYLIYATLDLAMNKIDPDTSTTAPNAAINQRVEFPPVGVEISQPTKVISVTTIMPSQNLR